MRQLFSGGGGSQLVMAAVTSGSGGGGGSGKGEVLMIFLCQKKLKIEDVFRCYEAPLKEPVRRSVRPSVRRSVRRSVTPSLRRRKKVFRSTLCRVSGLVYFYLCFEFKILLVSAS